MLTKEEKIETLDDKGYNLIANMERSLDKNIITNKGKIISIISTATDVGYGHDTNVHPIIPRPNSLSAEEAFELLEKDLKEREDAIKDMDVSFTQDQFNALVSLKYNVGYLGG